MVRTKGVSMKCQLGASSTPNDSDTITVTICCEDRREGVTTTTVKPKRFVDRAHLFLPGHGGFNYMVAWNKLQGWLNNDTGLDPCSHPYVIDCILNFCASYNLPKSGSIDLDVDLEIADQYSYVPKQPRLHPRDDHQQQHDCYDYQSSACCDDRQLKKFRLEQLLQL